MVKRQQKKERTRERIIQEALALFKSQGFKQTSVLMITEKAQIAKGTFFNYFSTKESLLIELQKDRITSSLAFLQEAHIQTLPLMKKLNLLLTYLLSYYEVDALIIKQAFLTPMEEQVEEIPLIQLFQLFVQQSQIRGEIRTDISDVLVAECFFGIFISSIQSFNGTNKEALLENISQKLRLSLEGFSIQRGSKQMKKNIVILGGGYGGLRIIQRLLSASLPSDVQIVLVDRMPYHCLKTEYYALAAGTEPDSAVRVAFPNDPRLMIKYGEITHIDIDKKEVQIQNQDSLSYDFLIVGLGCEDKYHGVPGAEQFTYSIQTIEKTRQTYQVLINVKPYGRVAIVGGGLSGVELASELRESRPDLQVQIYDRGESILSPFPEKLRKYVRQWFMNHNVDLIHKANITRVEENKIYNHDQDIEVDAVVWTAGIQANRLVRQLPVEKDQMGRVLLTKHHYIPNYEDVFVVGDCASLPFAPSAQLAEAQGDHIAIVLQAILKGEQLPAELPKIKLKGVLGSLGKKHGFGLMGERTLIGRVPRVLKTGVLWMYKQHSG